MKKRLFCVLLAVSMIGSSVTVHATEADDPMAMESPVSEGQADVTGEIQEPGENEGEETENTDVTPDIIPGEDEIFEEEPVETPGEGAEDIPDTEPAEIPEEEPVETPEVIPTEAPEEEPEETPEVTPTGVPTQEPEITPSAEPTEIPEGSPSPDMLVTPGIMEEFEEGIEPIMDDGMMRAAATPVPATWTGYLQNNVGKGNNGNSMYSAVYVDGDSNGEAGIAPGVELQVKRIRLRIRDALFNCYGTIRSWRAANETYVTSAIYLEDPNRPFSLMKEGRIWVRSGSILRIQNGDANLGGTIDLEEGAKLIVEKNADISGATINMGNNSKLAVLENVSFDNVTIVTSGSVCVVEIQGNCMSFENVTVKGSDAPTFKFFKNVDFGGQINIYRGTKITVGGDVQFNADTVITATGTGSTVSTVTVDGNCTNAENIALKGKGITVAINGDADIKGPIVLENSNHELTVGKIARFYPGSSVSGSGSFTASDHTEYIADGTSDFLVNMGLNVGSGLLVSGNGVVFLNGTGNIITDSCEVSGGTLKIDGDFNFGFDNIVVNAGGGMEIGTQEKNIGSFPQGQVDIKINGGTVRVTGDYIVSNGSILDINSNGILNVDGKIEHSSGSVTVSSGARLETGTSGNSGDYTQNGGKLEISGGTIYVADNFRLSQKGVDVKIDLNGTLAVGGKLDLPMGSVLVGANSKLETGISSKAGDIVCDKGNLQIKGGTVQVGGSLFLMKEQTTRNTDSGMTSGNILISDGGRLEVGTSAAPGNLKQDQGSLQINGGTAIVTGNYLLADETAAGSIMVGADSKLEIGTAEKPGNLSHSTGTLNIAGGTVHVTGNHDLLSGSVLDLGAGSVLQVDGNFVKNSGTSASYTEGIIKVGKDVDLRDSFNGTGNFRLVMNGKDGQKIISKNSRNKLNVQLEGRNVTTVGTFEPTLYSDGAITPEGGTLAVTSLKVNGHKLKIYGDVEATGKVDVGGQEGRLEVTGNYIQPSDYLKLSGGEVIINGDYRIQKKDKDGKYSASIGGLIMNPNAKEPSDSSDSSEPAEPSDPSTSRLTVNGSFYMESPNASLYNYWGTMTVKGNIEQKEAGGFDRFEGYGNFRLILAGDGPQTVSIESKDSVLNQLELKNENVTIKGYLNAKLVADGTITLPEKGTLEITGLELQGNKLTIKGGKDSLVKASGNVDMGGTGGHLVVPGDYMQASGILRIGEGTMDVGNDLLILDRDENNNDKTGEGSLIMTGSQGRLNVKGDIIVQSRRNTTLSSGTLVLEGDLIQKKGTDGRGTGYVNSTSTSHKLILAGDGHQNIKFDNEKGVLGTLQLTKDKSEYDFDPDEISMKVTIGPVPTPQPPATEQPTPQPPGPGQPTPQPPGPTPGTQPSGWPFSDVPVNAGNWRYDSVKYVYDNGIMNGISGTDRFEPDGPLTRGMFATVLYRMAGEPPVDTENRFTDVRDDKYYAKAIVWANSKGIVGGLDGGTRFAPEEYITREQIAKMLYEFGKSQDFSMDDTADLSEFPDNSDVSGWAVNYMKWAVGSGMINGKNIDGAHYLDPRGNATRVECAAMLTRFMKNIH